jgi:hypothetical protein
MALLAGLSVYACSDAESPTEITPDPTPSQIIVTAGNGQTALTGATVGTLPAVTVKDAAGNGVANVSVTFEIESGGGSVSGATANTDASGVATVGGWTLGIVPGEQKLRARAGTLTTSITATAALPTGCTAAAYAIGASIPATWESSDCVSPGTRGLYDPEGSAYDEYEFTLAAATQFRAQVTGPDARSVRIRRKDTGAYVGVMASEAFTPPTSNPLEIKYALPAGTYIAEVQAPDAATLGGYTFATVGDSTMTCSPVIFGALGVTINDEIDTATDCAFLGGYEDRLIMLLNTGDKLKLTLTTAAFNPLLVLRDDRLGPESPTLAVVSSPTPGTVVIDWEATFSGFYEVIMTRTNDGGEGAYTLQVEEVP